MDLSYFLSERERGKRPEESCGAQHCGENQACGEAEGVKNVE
jgi:hypothetical protein